jgi:hypothetical protein
VRAEVGQNPHCRATFPSPILWSFRVAFLGGQAIVWTVTGPGFGALADRAASRN